MPAIKSMEELNRVRKEVLVKKQSTAGPMQVIIPMGSCGIAVGARTIWESFLNCIENERLEGISVTKTGCIGLCEHEPIVQVRLGNQPTVVYGHVDERVVRQIVKQHIQNGKPVTENVIDIGNSILGRNV